MMQKFIHRHENDLEWTFKGIVTMLQKSQKYEDTGEQVYEYVDENSHECMHH